MFSESTTSSSEKQTRRYQSQMMAVFYLVTIKNHECRLFVFLAYSFFFSDSGYRIEKVTKSYKEWNFLRNFPMSRGFSENYSQKCDFSVTILHKSIYPKISKRAKRVFGDLS